jgi:hypothetical protein
MKRIIYFFALSFPILLNAQAPKWEMIYGIPNWDEYLEAIIEQYDGGIYLNAYSEKLGERPWAIKADVNGELLYDKKMLHQNYSFGSSSIVSDSLGNIYIGGTSFPGNNSLPNVIKIDPCGEVLWCKHFNLTTFNYGGGTSDIVLNHKNELVVLMTFSTGDTGDQIYLACLDENGNELWFDSYAKKKDYPLLVDPLGYDLLEHNNEYFIAGDCYYPYPEDPTHVYLRAMFIGIDSTFKEKFMTPFYALDSIFGWIENMIPINDSTIMGGGIRKQNGGKDYSLLAFINTRGTEIGFKEIKNSDIGSTINNNMIYKMERINDSLFFAAWSYGTETSMNPSGELVFDTAASLYKYASHPNTLPNQKLIKDHKQNFIIGTSTLQNNDFDILLYKVDQNLDPVPFDTVQHVYDSLCPHTIQSGEMDLTSCLVIISIDDWPTPDQYYESIRWIPIKAFPNPVKDGKLTLEFENTEHHQNMELRCYDNFGRQVLSQKVYKGQQDTDLDVSGWSSGIYIAVVYSNGGASGKVKFLVE